MSLRILVADDSIPFQRTIAEELTPLPHIKVVGTVANGKLAVQRVRELHPDLLTLDMEMPRMDGLAVLDALGQGGEKVAVIVVSAVTRRGAQVTMQALENGAFDFITKPDTGDAKQGRAFLCQELGPRVRALATGLKSGISCASSRRGRLPSHLRPKRPQLLCHSPQT